MNQNNSSADLSLAFCEGKNRNILFLANKIASTYSKLEQAGWGQTFLLALTARARSTAPVTGEPGGPTCGGSRLDTGTEEKLRDRLSHIIGSEVHSEDHNWGLRKGQTCHVLLTEQHGNLFHFGSRRPVGTCSPTAAEHRWLLSCAAPVKYRTVCKVSTPQLFHLFVSVEFIIQRVIRNAH